MHQPTSIRLVLAASAALLVPACGGDSSDPPPPSSPPAFTTGQAAEVVIGQADFTSRLANRGGPVGATTLSNPKGNPAVIGGRLYLPDSSNNRVLGFNAIPTTNAARAGFVLGQTSMSGWGAGLSAMAFSRTRTVTSDGTNMALADDGNHRVLLWNPVPTTTNAAADVVVGKSSFTSIETTCDERTLSGTEGAMLVAGKLIVTDSSHHRVLVWNSVPTSSYAAADLVLGQPDFTTCSVNTNGLSASSMSAPASVWSDGTRLLVADRDNHRVLLWNSFPTANGEAADVVLGQLDFTTAAAGRTASTLNWPAAVSSNGAQLAVADYSNNRVLVWNSFPTANGAPADVVLGQANFTSTAAAVSATRMSGPAGVLFHEDLLIVGESGNNRYVVFRSLP